MTKYQKAHLVLPADAAEKLEVAHRTGDRQALQSYIVALREAGWTYESMAKPLGVSRERIRQLYSEVMPYGVGLALAEAERVGFVVPERPELEVKVREKKYRPEPDAEVLARLKELKPYAERVRSNATRYRAEAEEYVSLLNEEYTGRGVPMLRLAKELGVTHAAIRSRLVRYGYLQTESGAKAYTPIRSSNRA